MDDKQRKRRNAYSKLLMLTILAIDQEEQLRENDAAGYKHNLKKFGGFFKKELERVELDVYLQIKGKDLNKKESCEFYEQLMQGVNVFNDITDILLNIENDAKRMYFSQGLDDLVKKLNLNN